MLVLTRRVGEFIYLDCPDGLPAGAEIAVTVVRIEGGQVRIGFEAPPSVKILRGELIEGSKGR